MTTPPDQTNVHVVLYAATVGGRDSDRGPLRLAMSGTRSHSGLPG